MTRSLSSRSDAHRQRADVAWIRLMALKLWRDRYGAAPASLTLYFSDRTRYVPVDGDDDREYLGLVLTWGTVGDSLEALSPGTSPASVDPTLANTVPITADGVTVDRFTDLIREGENTTGYDPGGAEITVSWLPPGGTLGIDDVVLYAGRLDTIEPTDEPTVHLQSTSNEGTARIPILDFAVGTPCGELGPCPAWLVGKAFVREIRYDGDIIGGVPDFGDVDTGTTFEIDAAWVGGFGASPPTLRDSETLIWNDLRSSLNPDRYQGYYYIYARDTNTPFTGLTLPWFNDGTTNKIRNLSSVSGTGTYSDDNLTGDIQILELEDLATQGAFDALKPSVPPTVKRLIATLTPPETTNAGATPTNWPEAPTVNMACVRFFAIRFTQWLTEFPLDFFDGGANERLSNLVMTINPELS